MRFCLCLLLCSTALAAGPPRDRLAWVTAEKDNGTNRLSNGELFNSRKPAAPGQYVKAKKGGELEPIKQWRPPQDLEFDYKPEREGRVVYSHERHFAALHEKNCNLCHAATTGLGSGKPWPSLAPNAALEPHADKSLGRFCTACHQEPRADLRPPPTPAFTALGRHGDAACAKCHPPADHGPDYTAGHTKPAKDGKSMGCVTCHRGTATITSAELAQADTYHRAQVALLRNAQDPAAFAQTLPNNFCAYCHIPDRKAWKGPKK